MNQFFLKKNIYAVVLSIILISMMIFYIDEKSDEIVAILNSCLTDSDHQEAGMVSKTLEQEMLSIEYYDCFIYAYDWIQNFLNKSEIRDFSYIKEKSGFLYYGSFYEKEDEDLLKFSKQLRRLKEKAGGDTSFIFISPPEKDSSALVLLENAKIISKSDRIQDEFLLYMQYMQIDALDLRETFKNSEYLYEELYYKTDRHWTTIAAFESFKAIVDKLCVDYGESLDSKYLDINNYHVNQYDNIMKGTIGEEIGAKYTDLDNFILITPKFDSDYLWEYTRNNGTKGSQQGPFEDSLLMLDKLNIKTGSMETPYEVYLNRINAWDKITNRQNPDGLKILCIRDAYFSPIAAFMMPYCSELHLISPFDSEIDIERYIEENDFDYVFVEYYPGKITSKGFPFFNDGKEVGTE